jgi:hypothetical protein
MHFYEKVVMKSTGLKFCSQQGTEELQMNVISIQGVTGLNEMVMNNHINSYFNMNIINYIKILIASLSKFRYMKHN